MDRASKRQKLKIEGYIAEGLLSSVMWEVEATEEFLRWYGELSGLDKTKIDERVRLLEASGPALGRPAADTLTGSKIANLKELRASSLRVLYAFDPKRRALLLLGGDKAGRWKQWYREAIPQAESLWFEHLRKLEKEGRGERDG